MARVFGSATRIPAPNRAVLSWLELLGDEFSVFLDVEGSDFYSDFLIIKPYGIFNVEASSLPIMETRVNADWLLETREARPDPFTRLLDQCDRIKDYLLVQRGDIFSADQRQAAALWSSRDQLKIFPVVALSRPSNCLSITRDKWRRVFADSGQLRRHLITFEWFPNLPKRFCIDDTAVRKLSDLWHLVQLQPWTLVPVAHPVVVHRSPRASPQTQNPYQYTYTVTGDCFYGRQYELMKIKRALESAPPRPIIITGLQRTGKSSLAKESIRRYTSTSGQYTTFSFDFRLFSERESPTEDLALEFLAEVTRGASGLAIENASKAAGLAGLKGKTGDQRRLLRESLRKNRERGRHNVLLLDECQEIEKYLTAENHKSFFGFIDTLCRDSEIALHAILVCRPRFLELQPIVDLNLGRLCETITLGPLNVDAAKELVSHGEPRLRFTPSAKERLRCLAGGHPFWIQFLCHSVFERAIFNDRFEVDDTAVDECFSGIVADRGCRPQFYILFQDIQEDGLAYSLLQDVAELAEHEMEPIDPEHLGERWHDRQLLRKALRRLLDNQILVPESSRGLHLLKFGVEALRVWMRENVYTLPDGPGALAATR